jgi:hypothetical protein
MAKKPRQKGKRLPKTTKEWEALNTDAVIREVFGPDGHKTLKDEALRHQPKPEKAPE